MSFIEYIKNLFTNNKKNCKITTKELKKIKGETTPLEIILTDNENKPIPNKTVSIEINGVNYDKKTGNDGIAKLNINLNCGQYTALCTFKGDEEYNATNAYAKVRISPKIVTSNLTKTQGDSTQFTAKFTDINGNSTPAKSTFNINGVNYDRTSNPATLNINLGAGEYKITTTSVDSTVTNTVKVNPKPVVVETPVVKDCPNPYTQKPVLTSQGANGMGQLTGYSCGANSLQQAFYNLTGKNISESTIMSWAGTTTAGTSHQGLETAVAKFNKTYGTNIKIQWKNLSDFGSNINTQFTNIGKLVCEGKFVFFHLLYRNQWGHYEAYQTFNKNNNLFAILNSLGNKSGSSYLGYIESRSASTQKQYISGISQPSVAILYKG